MTTHSVEVALPRVTSRPESAGAHGGPGRSIFRSVWSVAATLAVVVMTLVAVATMALTVASHLSARGQFQIFGHPTLTVMSGSMTPTIRTGDLVIDDRVSAAQASSLHVGQIITFRVNGSQVFTHRIAGVEHEAGGAVAYVTKGDANNAPDGALRPASSVVGLYQTKIPYGGYILNALRDPIVLILVGISLLLAFMAAPLFRWARSADAQTENDPAPRVGTAKATPAETSSAASLSWQAESFGPTSINNPYDPGAEQ